MFLVVTNGLDLSRKWFPVVRDTRSAARDTCGTLISTCESPTPTSVEKGSVGIKRVSQSNQWELLPSQKFV